jgi:hypothetical protein
MRFLLKLILLLILALPLVVAGLIYLVLDSAPSIDRAAEITPANIARAKRILDQNDPRKLTPGVRRTIFVSQNDLDLAANYLARQYAAGGARIQLQRGIVKIGASLKLPVRSLPIYLNLDATLAETGALPHIESLRLGKLPMPASLAYWLIARAVAFALADVDMRYFRSVVKKVAFAPSRAALTYEWQANLPAKLRTVLLPAREQNRLRLYQERLAAVTRALKANDVSLTELLAPLFALAAERSTDDDAVAENRSAILLLTLYVNGQGIEKFVPEAKNWPRPAQHRVLLNERDDFPKHFIVSAALAAKAGAPLADAVGVYKELADARGGSGFSFNDIAADRAGTRFGEYAGAPASARRLQQRLRAGTREKDFMPGTADLPEFIPEVEFIRRFGGVDTPAYKKMLAEIERCIAALPLYQ